MIIKEGMIFRHFTGEYVSIVAECKNVITDEYEVVYKGILSGEVSSIDLREFEAVIPKGVKVNKTHQKHVFEEVDLTKKLSLDHIPTFDLIKELSKRENSPHYEKDLSTITDFIGDTSFQVDKYYTITRKWSFEDEDGETQTKYEPLNDLGVCSTKEECVMKLQSLLLSGKNVQDLCIVKTIDYEEIA